MLSSAKEIKEYFEAFLKASPEEEDALKKKYLSSGCSERELEEYQASALDGMAKTFINGTQKGFFYSRIRNELTNEYHPLKVAKAEQIARQEAHRTGITGKNFRDGLKGFLLFFGKILGITAIVYGVAGLLFLIQKLFS